MNVQLTAKPAKTRSGERTQRTTETCARPSESPATFIAAPVREEQKWLAIGVFYLLAGMIISNSGWSTHEWGYPLMLLSLFMPLVPGVRQLRAVRKARAAQASRPVTEIVRRRNSRRLVYELNSKDYAVV